MNRQEYAEVSVIIPTYNRREAVCRAVESVLSQTVRPSEIVVVDDGSTDDTKSTLADRFGAKLKYVGQKNGGVAAARNEGVYHSNCEFIAFLDSDDIWLPDKLERQLPIMANPEIVLSATNWVWNSVKQDDVFSTLGQNSVRLEVVDEPLARLASLRGHGILVQSSIMRRETFLKLGGFNSDFRISEDTDFLFRIAGEGKFAILPEVLLVRARDDRLNHLTNVDSIHWQRERLANGIRIVEMALEHSSAHSKSCQRQVRRRLVRLLVDKTKLEAATGNEKEARLCSKKGLANGREFNRDLVKCIVGSILPRVMGMRRRQELRAKNGK